MTEDMMLKARQGNRRIPWRGKSGLAGALAVALLAAGAPDGAARAAPACEGAALSRGDVAAVRTLLARNDLAAALAQARDPAARKLLRWLHARRNLRRTPARELLAFTRENPRWPLAGVLRANAETKLLLNGSDEELTAHFKRHKPTSAAGRVALARHLSRRGETKRATALLKAAWRDPNLPQAVETYILRKMHRHLTRADDVARLWQLIMAQKTRQATRFAQRLPTRYRQAAAVARALMLRQRGAEARYRRLPAAMRDTQALRYALARHYRRSRQPLKALSVLKGVPVDHERLVQPFQWWTERRLVARHLLQDKYRRHWHVAQHLATQHGYPLHRKSKPAFRGEFLAGFIALEKLGQPKTALKHFTRLPKLATNRTLKSKAWYWIGRARERLGDLEGAWRAHMEAAKTPSVYYGLLAREKLGKGRQPIPLRTARATERAKCRVRAHELGKAARLLAAAGQKDMLFSFIWPLALAFDDRSELAAAAALMWDLGGPTMAVRLAKAASMRGLDIDNYGYPIKALPPHKSRENSLELPVVLALVRQESEFNPRARSSVGARGLMQLMPATARLEARHVGVRYHTGWLTSRPAYNLLLGRHHLARIIDNFDGSYILAFAAYNAGPGNVRKWLQAYGDPRANGPDPVEWVELIPFTETRNYVQKVLQGTHVYRTRLKRPMSPISRDLWRARPGWRELVLRGVGAASRTARGEKSAGKGIPVPIPRPAITPASTRGECSARGAASITDLIGKC